MPDHPPPPVLPTGLARVRITRVQGLEFRFLQRVLPDLNQPADLKKKAIRSSGIVRDYTYRGKSCADLELATRRLEEIRRIGAQRPGRRAAPCVAMVCLGPPPFGGPGAWSLRDLQNWGVACAWWVTVRCFAPPSVVAALALHLFGRAPAFHALAVVADPHGVPGWNGVARRFGKTGEENGRQLMSLMLTSYAKNTGLRRPAPYATRRRVGLRERVETLERQVRQLRGERDAAIRGAAALSASTVVGDDA